MSEVVPIFPLPGLVFLPGELLPLHVFEPRYRALIEHAQKGEGRFAMATIAGEGKPPEVHPWVGYGRVVEIQELEDGRSYLMLSFEQAGRIEEELEVDTPFRQVKVSWAAPIDDADYGSVRSLRTLALQVVAMLPEFPQRDELFAREGGALVDGLARLFLRESALRLEYLAATTARERIALVETVLAAAMAQLTG